MEGPRILIISDDPQFSFSLANVWNGEPRPAFSMATSDRLDSLAAENFDVAVLGACQSDLRSRIMTLARCRVPLLQIAASNEKDETRVPGAIQIPRVEQWPELAKIMAVLVIDRERFRRQAAELAEGNRRLEDQAVLGRYMLDVRLNLNNALTSILGNSELMLAATEPLSSKLREQLETIRNMGMRVHEILQRFSSLEKEMQLIGQQNPRKAAKARAGA